MEVGGVGVGVGGSVAGPSIVGRSESFLGKAFKSTVEADPCAKSFFCRGRLRLPRGVDLVAPYPPPPRPGEESSASSRCCGSALAACGLTATPAGSICQVSPPTGRVKPYLRSNPISSSRFASGLLMSTAIPNSWIELPGGAALRGFSLRSSI